jgi:hypothetical protein
MELPARLGPIDHLDATDLDDPVATGRVEPGRVRVEDDLPHGAG